MSEHPLANYPRPPPRGVDLPHSDGDKMESERHFVQMTILIQSLKTAWAHRDDFYVGGDMFVYFSETQARNNDFRGPDFFVVLDTSRKERNSWVVWEEDGRTPDVVIELLSPSTEHVDRGRKKDIYANTLKVSEYYLYDPFSYTLEGFALDPVKKAYAPIPADAEGKLPCVQLGLWLVVRETSMGYDERVPMLRWVDEAGALLPTDEERAANAATSAAEAESKAAEAESRAQEERARADALAERIRALEAKLAGE